MVLSTGGMPFARLNRDTLTPGLSPGGLQSVFVSLAISEAFHGSSISMMFASCS